MWTTKEYSLVPYMCGSFTRWIQFRGQCTSSRTQSLKTVLGTAAGGFDCEREPDAGTGSRIEYPHQGTAVLTMNGEVIIHSCKREHTLYYSVGCEHFLLEVWWDTGWKKTDRTIERTQSLNGRTPNQGHWIINVITNTLTCWMKKDTDLFIKRMQICWLGGHLLNNWFQLMKGHWSTDWKGHLFTAWRTWT